MTLKTPEEYITSIQRDVDLYMFGEKIKEFWKHPIIIPSINTVKKIYELAQAEEYKDIMGLSWAEEDSLKYHFFFYVYAQDQRNLINFSGEGEEYRSMFFGEDSTPPDYWFSSNRSDPRMLLSSLGVSESRILGFLEEMETKEIVSERYYPLSSFSFFSEDDKIFVITDIKDYMRYITDKFLTPVVNSLLG